MANHFAEDIFGQGSRMSHHLGRVARDKAIEQSLDVALEIEEVLRGERDEFTALNELTSNLIGDDFIPDQLSGNPITANLYRRAYMSSGAANPTPKDAEKMIERLSKLGNGSPKDVPQSELKELRDFCLGINRELVSEAWRRLPESPMARIGRHELKGKHVDRVQYR